MKILVKNIGGGSFEIEVKPEDTVADVKKTIQSRNGADSYPAGRQMLIHKGKVLKDSTTMEENKVAENNLIVVMLTKNKVARGEGSTTSSAPIVKAPQTSRPPTSTRQPPAAVSGVYGKDVPNLVAGNYLEETIQNILGMGEGNWDRDMVVRALHAAYSNPDQAAQYLSSGIPESAEGPSTSRSMRSEQAASSGSMRSGQAASVRIMRTGRRAPIPSNRPNRNPLNLFPQHFPSTGSNAGGANALDFLRYSPQFRAFRASMQANPWRLLSVLRLLRLILQHEADFLRIVNEPIDDEERIMMGQLGGASAQALTFTRQEREAIQRLEAMGFCRTTVMQVFLACDKNEELTANYLLDHMHDFDE